ADRVVDLLAVERELVADLSHRLRTPLTALCLEADRMGPTPSARRIAEATAQLESELDAVITAARAPLAVSQPGGAADAAAQPCAVGQGVGARVAVAGVRAAARRRPG